MKARFSTIPLKVLREVVDCFTRGASKKDGKNEKTYGEYGWRTTPDAKATYVDALQRHMLAWCDGDIVDGESGQSHMVHVIANAMILRDLEIYNAGQSDWRNGKESVEDVEKRTSYDLYSGARASEPTGDL